MDIKIVVINDPASAVGGHTLGFPKVLFELNGVDVTRAVRGWRMEGGWDRPTSVTLEVVPDAMTIAGEGIEVTKEVLDMIGRIPVRGELAG